MNKFITVFLILLFCVSFTGCGDRKRIDNKTYETYGLFNEGSMRNDKIEYRVIIGNVGSVLLCETIIAPIYFFRI